MKHHLRFGIFFLILFSLVGYATEITDGGFYKISTTYTGNRSLSVENSSLNNNVKVFLWTETAVPAQRWKVIDAGDNNFFIENAYSGKHLQAQSATNIVQNEPGSSNSYKWSFEKVENSDDLFYITHAQRAGCLELANSPDIDKDGSPIRFNTKSASPEARQIWRIEKVADQKNELTPQIREQIMTGWKNSHFQWLTTSKGFWGEAEAMEILLDAYETTGKEAYKIMFEEAYQNFVSGTSGGWGSNNSKNWSWNEFNDDIAWAVLASIRAHFMFGDHPKSDINYLTIAKNNFDMMYARALYKVDNLYYVLRWKQGQEGTTSCVNGPSEIAACYLGIATGEDLYFQKAKMLYDSQRMHMYEPSTGRVYDSFDNNWASTYNQGTYLGAALMLYNRYGESMYKKDAEKIIEFSKNHLCNSNGIINANDSENGDFVNFKAILLRYVRRFVDDLGRPEYGEWLQKNALQAYNNRNSSGISRMSWETKTGESNEWNGAGAMAAVAVAMNAPIDLASITKDAFNTIEAGSFNYISRVHTQNNTSGNVMEIVDIQNGAYLGYNRVDCQNDYANKIELLVANGSGERTVEVRLGSPTGNIIGTVTIPASDNTWKTVQGNLSLTLKKRHNIYLVFKGNQNTLKFKSFQFISGGTDYVNIVSKDITDDGGSLIAQYEGFGTDEGLDKLTDNSVDTKYLVKNQSALWVQYQSTSRYILTSYSVSSANDAEGRDPKDWMLYGSQNGNTWELIDKRENQKFGQRKATQSYSIDSDQAFSFFKLDIIANNGDADTQIAEWQLLGELYTDPYTHDFIEVSKLSTEANLLEGELSMLSDNDPLSYCSFDASELPVNIQFYAPVPVQLQGYTLTSSPTNPDNDPKAWSIYGSKDGETWVKIDARSNQSFESRGLKRVFDRTNPNDYNYFRLEVTALNASTASSLDIAEWEFFGFHISSTDLTSNPAGKLSAQWEGKYKPEDNIDERYTKLIDNNKAGKYLADKRKTFWVTYQSPEPVRLGAYSLTSANDAPNRDPKNWTLYASKNNSTWTILDKQENQDFPYRYSSLYFTCNTTEEYRYFKLDVEDNHGEKSVQLAEWQLFETAVLGLNSVKESNFTVYPNPADQYVTVNTTQMGFLEIFSLSGEKILSQPLANHQNSVYVGDLQKGIYMIRLLSEHNAQSEILIKK